MFELALLNPLRFIDTGNIDFGFDGNFAIDQVLSYQDPKCYFQKWQRSDVLKLQLLSDYIPENLVFKDTETDVLILESVWQIQSTQLVGQTFSVYEISVPFNLLPNGRYYLEQRYTDANNLKHLLVSEPIFVADEHNGTTLLKYRHSENDFDVIFDTNIEFQFRVESAIKNYMPGTDRTVFLDQMANPTLVSAMPYRKFKYFIGYGQGVPDWVFDKVTHILAVNQVKFNGIFYQVADGAEYEAERNDANNYIGGSIDVQPTDNRFNKYKTIDKDETNSFIPMQKILKYFNQGDNVVVSGVFKNFSLLEKICISKRSADFTLKVGTTNGGDDIGEFEVNKDENTFTIEELFNVPATIYVSGLNGADVDMLMVYKQLDEAPVSTLPSTTSPEGIGSTKIYSELTDGDLERDFNVATGLGNSNTDWKGWAWMDGRNGTPNWTNRTPSMTDDINNIGELIGNSTITLTKAQLPAVGVGLFSPSTNTVGGDAPGVNDYVAKTRNSASWTPGNYDIAKGVGVPTVGKSANLGNGDAVNITPLRVKALWVMKISN